jgi:hypothetical protein
MVDAVISASHDVIFVCDVNGCSPPLPVRAFQVKSQWPTAATAVFKVTETAGGNPSMGVTGDIYRGDAHVINETSGANSIVLFQFGTTTKASIKSSGLGVFDHSGGGELGGVRVRVDSNPLPSGATTDKGHVQIGETAGTYYLFVQTCQGGAIWKTAQFT